MRSTPGNADQSVGIGQSIAAFMHAVQTLGAASAKWAKRQTAPNAIEMENACGAVETALAMVVLSVSQGVSDTREGIRAWRQEREAIMPGSVVGRVVLPSSEGEVS